MSVPNVKLRITNSNSPSHTPQPPGVPPSPPSQSSSCTLHGDPVGLLEQRLHRVEGRVARVQDTDKVVASVDRVRHQLIERGEVVLPIGPEELLVGLLADPDVEPKDAVTVEIRSVVEIAVVLGHDRRERKAPRV